MKVGGGFFVRGEGDPSSRQSFVIMALCRVICVEQVPTMIKLRRCVATASGDEGFKGVLNTILGRSAGLICLLLCTLDYAHAAPADSAHPDTVKKAKNAVDRTLAIYIPQNESDSRIFIPQLGASFAPGKALEDAAVDAGNFYFKSASLFNAKSATTFNWVLAAHSKWETKERVSTLTIKYKLLDAKGTAVFESEKKEEINSTKLFEGNSFYSLSLSVMKDILSDDDLLGKAASAASNSVDATAAAFDYERLVSREKATKSGTGFYINGRGQVLTAAHVVHDCPVIVVKVDGKATDAKLVAESLLLDLAVIDTNTASAHSIPLRIGTSYDLGEGVTNVGFPLDGLLAGSPNVTRGNISSRTALTGSLGQFQFSAPVQPGSSGGPVVSDTGELLGVTVGTLGVAGLIQRGILPQNVNFALDARYAVKFLERNKITYVSVAPNPKSDAHVATEAALAAVVQLACYQ
jgi:serine protease Do